MKPNLASFALALCALALLLSTGAPAAAQDDQFGKSMEAYLQKDENVEKIGNALQRFFMKKQQDAQKDAEKAEKDRVEEQFKSPVKIDIGQSPVRGPADAKITIVQFSEFQCPYCKRGAANVEEVMKAFPTQVKVVFKNFPLPFHAQAKGAAAAALAAKNQGKFWEMHDLLFANQQALGEEKYLELAKQLGLNEEQFKTDLTSEKTQKAIEDDSTLGETVGIRGTPGYFINGVQLTGAQPPEAFKPIINRWLEMSK